MIYDFNIYHSSEPDEEGVYGKMAGKLNAHSASRTARVQSIGS